MILLVTPSERASECAAALQQATGETVTVAENSPRATTLLRAETYAAVVLDQYLLETEPSEAEITLTHLETAIPVEVNFAINGMGRLLRQVQAALRRRQREEARARHAAQAKLLSELNGTVTPLLLSIELAAETPGLPVATAEKLRSARELVNKLRKQLETDHSAQEREAAATS